MRRFILAFACMILVNGLLQAQQPTILSLDQAVQYAMEHNPTLERSQISITDASQQIIERRAIGLPQLSAAVNYQYFLDIPTQILPDFISPSVYGVLFQEGVLEPRELEPAEGGVPAQFGTKQNLTAGLNLDAMIFDGSFFVGLEAAREYRNLVQGQYNADQYTLKSQVIDVYLPVLLIDMNLVTLADNLGNLERLLGETRALYEEGFVESLDVDRLVLSLDNLQTEYNKLERQRSQALNALKMVLGYPMEAELEVEGTIAGLLSEGETVDLTSPVNLGARPEYQSAQNGQNLQELNVRLNKSLYLPSLYAFGSHQQSLLADNLSDGEWFPTTVVGLNLRIPIFDGLNKKAKVQRAQLSLENTQSQIRELEQFINMEVANARLSYNNAQQTLDDRQNNLDLANRIYNTTLIKYKEGVGSSLEINQAEQSLFMSQQNYNLALYDLLVAKMALKRAMGQL